jgi:hypothetical protein
LTFGKQNYGPENRPVLLGRRKKQVWARSGLLPGVNRERDRAEESLSEWRSSSAHREGLSCPYSQFGLLTGISSEPLGHKAVVRIKGAAEYKAAHCVAGRTGILAGSRLVCFPSLHRTILLYFFKHWWAMPQKNTHADIA